MTDTSIQAKAADDESLAGSARPFQSDALKRLLDAAAEREKSQPPAPAEPEWGEPQPQPKPAPLARKLTGKARREAASAPHQPTAASGPVVAAATAEAPPVGLKAAEARVTGVFTPPFATETATSRSQNNTLTIAIVIAALISAVAIWLTIFSS